MKITPDGIATIVTNVVAIATMAFGLSQDAADVITKAAPTIVGGIMSASTVITYLINKRKERVEVFKATVGSMMSDNAVVAKGSEDRIRAVAKSLGML